MIRFEGRPTPEDDVTNTTGNTQSSPEAKKPPITTKELGRRVAEIYTREQILERMRRIDAELARRKGETAPEAPETPETPKTPETPEAPATPRPETPAPEAPAAPESSPAPTAPQAQRLLRLLPVLFLSGCSLLALSSSVAIPRRPPSRQQIPTEPRFRKHTLRPKLPKLPTQAKKKPSMTSSVMPSWMVI